jgi:hypothetical protein
VEEKVALIAALGGSGASAEMTNDTDGADASAPAGGSTYEAGETAVAVGST